MIHYLLACELKLWRIDHKEVDGERATGYVINS